MYLQDYNFYFFHNSVNMYIYSMNSLQTQLSKIDRQFAYLSLDNVKRIDLFAKRFGLASQGRVPSAEAVVKLAA